MIWLLLLLVASYLFYYFTGNIVLFLGLVCVSIFIVLWGSQLVLISAKQQVAQAQGNIEDGFQKRHDVLIKVLDTVRSDIAKRNEDLEKLWCIVDEKRVMPKGVFGLAVAQGDYEQWYQETRRAVVDNISAFSQWNSQSHKLLIQSINDVEENLSAARRFYNFAVKEYNEKLEGFPTGLIAKVKKYEPKSYFTVENEEVRKDIQIKIG